MKDRTFGIVMLIVGILVLLNAFKEFRIIKTSEDVLWSTYGMAYGGVILGILIVIVAFGILKKK